METACIYAALLILVVMVAGLFRVVRGPSHSDRIMAAQLVGTLGVGELLLLSRALDAPAFKNVALVFALMALVLVSAFVRISYARAEKTGGADGDV